MATYNSTCIAHLGLQLINKTGFDAKPRNIIFFTLTLCSGRFYFQVEPVPYTWNDKRFIGHMARIQHSSYWYVIQTLARTHSRMHAHTNAHTQNSCVRSLRNHFLHF